MLPASAFCQSATQTCIPTKVLDRLIHEVQEKDSYKELYRGESKKNQVLTKTVAALEQEKESVDEVVVSLTSMNEQYVRMHQEEVRLLDVKTKEVHAVTSQRNLLLGIAIALLGTTYLLSR